MKPNIKIYSYWPEAKDMYESRVAALMRLGFKLRNDELPGHFWVRVETNGCFQIKVSLELLDDCQGQTVFNFCERNKHCFNFPNLITSSCR